MGPRTKSSALRPDCLCCRSIRRASTDRNLRSTASPGPCRVVPARAGDHHVPCIIHPSPAAQAFVGSAAMPRFPPTPLAAPETKPESLCAAQFHLAVQSNASNRSP